MPGGVWRGAWRVWRWCGCGAVAKGPASDHALGGRSGGGGGLARGAVRCTTVASSAGLQSGPSFGPYSMTKHALEAMGKAMRAELAPQGIDVTLLNPGPYLTGFNDRMADSMWEWFGDGSLNA